MTTKRAHLRWSDLRGAQRLATDATVGLTDLVEAMHHTIAHTPHVFGTPAPGRTRGVTGFVYDAVRGVSRGVGAGVDALLGILVPMLSDRPSSPAREAVVSALNGVFGDYLAASANPLAIAMAVRSAGVTVSLDPQALAAAFPAPARNVVVMIHGLCMNDLHWSREGHDHGAALARDLGFTPLYLHYNSGVPIPANGRELAGVMNTLLRGWPSPIDRLVIIGHSMGGLVARSACYYATQARHDWPRRLQSLIFLGTPHFGAPLERAGAWAELLVGISPYTAPFARLGKVRSAGIKDLRHGCVREEDRQARSGDVRRVAGPLSLPEGVACYAIAASKQRRGQPSQARLRSDGLVPVNSALGRHRDPGLDLAIPAARQWVGFAMDHLDLLQRSEVYERIEGWLSLNPAMLSR